MAPGYKMGPEERGRTMVQTWPHGSLEHRHALHCNEVPLLDTYWHVASLLLKSLITHVAANEISAKRQIMQIMT